MSLFDRLPTDVLGEIVSFLTPALSRGDEKLAVWLNRGEEEEELPLWTETSRNLQEVLLRQKKGRFKAEEILWLHEDVEEMQSLWKIRSIHEGFGLSTQVTTRQGRVLNSLLKEVKGLETVFNSQMELENIVREVDIIRSYMRKCSDKNSLIFDVWKGDDGSLGKYSSPALSFAREMGVFQFPPT